MPLTPTTGSETGGTSRPRATRQAARGQPDRPRESLRALLDWSIEGNDTEMCFARADYGDALGFHRVENDKAPQWPGQDLVRTLRIRSRPPVPADQGNVQLRSGAASSVGPVNVVLAPASALWAWSQGGTWVITSRPTPASSAC